jgi:hypothetical protein
MGPPASWWVRPPITMEIMDSLAVTIVTVVSAIGTEGERFSPRCDG